LPCLPAAVGGLPAGALTTPVRRLLRWQVREGAGVPNEADAGGDNDARFQRGVASQRHAGRNGAAPWCIKAAGAPVALMDNDPTALACVCGCTSVV
jgi:hypothetical protein